MIEGALLVAEDDAMFQVVAVTARAGVASVKSAWSRSEIGPRGTWWATPGLVVNFEAVRWMSRFEEVIRVSPLEHFFRTRTLVLSGAV